MRAELGDASMRVLFVLRKRGDFKRWTGIGEPRAQKRSNIFVLAKLAVTNRDSGQRELRDVIISKESRNSKETLEVPHRAAVTFPRAKAYHHINPLILRVASLSFFHFPFASDLLLSSSHTCSCPPPSTFLAYFFTYL